MSVDSVDPVAIPTPDSDESWTELYERTCGEPTPTVGDRGREKRARSPEFIPENALNTMLFVRPSCAIRRPSEQIVISPLLP